MPIKLEKTALARKMVVKSKLIGHLEKAIDQGEFEWEFKYEPKQGDTAWHPSGDCTPSIYELYLKATGQTEYRQPSIGLRKTFMVGHFWHQYLQELTVRIGFAEPNAIERVGIKSYNHKLEQWQIGQSVPAARPYEWVRGAADIAPCSIPGFGDYLVDFKTMGSHDFKKITMPEWAADKYECQLNIYMDLFDMEKAIIVGINKDSPHDFKEFEFHRNQNLIDTIYRKWTFVMEHLSDGMTPPENADEIFSVQLPIKGPV